MLEVNREPAATSHGRTATAPALAHSARLQSVLTTNREPLDFNVKLPVIIGECHFKRSMSIDGLLSGKLAPKEAGSGFQLWTNFRGSTDYNLVTTLDTLTIVCL